MSVGKIILKSTTRMSLNDRFTVLRQEKPVTQGQAAPGIEERRQQAQASRRNQRLAQMMERRPAVVAALKLNKKTVDQRLNTQRPLAIKHRLAVKGRLSIPDENGMGMVMTQRGRGALRGMRGTGMRGVSVRGTSFRGGRGLFGIRGRGALGGGRGGMVRGMRGGRFMRGVRGGRVRGSQRGRGSLRGSPRGRPLMVQTRGTFRGRGRGRAGRIGRGRGGRGASSNKPQENCTREQLDQQLDEYMSKTKNALDTELDAYMKDATAAV